MLEAEMSVLFDQPVGTVIPGLVGCIECWPPEKAEAIFLEAFRELMEDQEDIKAAEEAIIKNDFVPLGDLEDVE
jgi:hypothetical protein